MKHPPLHVLVAAYLGVKPPERKAESAPTPANEEALGDLAKHGSFMPGGGWGQGDPHEGLGTPIMDFEKLKQHYAQSQ